jgi:hypothetical protein
MPNSANVRARWLTGRRSAAFLGLSIVLIIAGIVVWTLLMGSLRDRVEVHVRDGVPLGTPRLKAEEWIKNSYGMQPYYNPDVTGDQFVGHAIPDLAGVPADRLGGTLRFIVRPRGMLSDVVQQVYLQQVFVYLLLDKHDNVCAYFFLSLDELREMELEKLRRR